MLKHLCSQPTKEPFELMREGASRTFRLCPKMIEAGDVNMQTANNLVGKVRAELAKILSSGLSKFPSED